MKTTFCKPVYFDGKKIEIPAHGINIAPIIKAAEKHGGYLTVTLQTPQRPRTVGEHSQNHYIDGQPIPESEARYLIDDIIQLASELGIVLKGE